jgi:flagellar basal-body rod modification protein FlgD
MSTIPGISSTPPSATTTAKADQALGQDQFLTLLVAQLENQDPLNPTDATEFTAQLAQYSQLEQLFNLNDSMDELTNATSKSQSISALNLIGQDVVVEGNGFTLGDSPVDLGYKIDGTVTDLALTIKNGTGKIVATIAADNLNTETPNLPVITPFPLRPPAMMPVLRPPRWFAPASPAST